jgi:hypothetical protein
MLAERSMAYGPVGYGLLVGIGLAIGVLAVVSDLGRSPQRLGPALRRLFADPWSAASLGVLFTMAMSPLMWPHYFMLALIPMAAILRADGRWDAAACWTVASFVLFSRLLLGPLAAANQAGLVEWAMLLAWIPLVPALLARLGATAR